MTVERQLVSVAIDSELKVKMKFIETRILPLKDNDEENRVKVNKFSVESEERPHKDFVNSMKKLRKHALDLIEIDLNPETSSKDLPTYTVSALKIAGNYLLKKSRVTLTLAKYVKRSKKVCETDLPQVTMYPEKEEAQMYPEAEKMTAIIEDIIEECWSYLEGKYEDEDPGQLALFPVRQTEEA